MFHSMQSHRTSRSAPRFITALLVAACASVSGLAHAWGDEGHQVIGTIADHYLDPAVRIKVNQLLAADTSGFASGTDIAHEATWADHYRDSDRLTGPHYTRTHNWHFVDLELSGPDLNSACFGRPAVPTGTVASEGPKDDCVVDKINEFSAELKSPSTTDDEKRLALQFLLHFVGDLHQPLHASDDHDKGGNDKHVTANGLPAHNLHAYWDTEFVQRIGTDPTAVAQQLITQITDNQVATWTQGTVEDWAQESFQISRDHAYAPLPAPASNGNYALSTVYVNDAVQVINTQLQKAGVRLASVLNQAFNAPPAPSTTCTDTMRAGAIPALSSFTGMSVTLSETATGTNTTTIYFFFQSALVLDGSDPNGLPGLFQSKLRQAGWRNTAISASSSSYLSSWTVSVAGCGTLSGIATIVPGSTAQTYVGQIEVIHSQ